LTNVQVRGLTRGRRQEDWLHQASAREQEQEEGDSAIPPPHRAGLLCMVERLGVSVATSGFP
jgi:hypothetical protein